MKAKFIFLGAALCIANSLFAQQVEWAHALGSDVGSEYGNLIKSDANGNVYIAGRLFDLADFDVNPGSFWYLNPPNYHSGYIAKYDANMNIEWAKELGGPDYITVYDLAIASDGSVYAIGSFKDEINVDPLASNLTFTTAGNYDAFIAKYSASGQMEWAYQYGTNFLDQGFCVGLDPNEHVYFGGYYGGVIDLDPGSGTSFVGNQGAGDGFVVKFDAQGNFLGETHFGSQGYDQADALGFDALGNVYVTGEYHDICDFDPSPNQHLLQTSNIDAFIAKYDANLQLVWAYDIGGGTSFGSNCQAEEIVVEPNGDFAISGIFWGTSQFDPVDSLALITPNAGDCYISVYDANANFKWMRHIGQTQGTTGYAIDKNSEGQYIVAGNHYDSVDLDPTAGVNMTTTNGGRDAFVLCLDSLGDYEWAFTFGSAMEEGIFDASFDTDSTFLVTGIFSDQMDVNPMGSPFLLPTNGLQDVFIAKYAFPTSAGPNSIEESHANNFLLFPNPANTRVSITSEQAQSFSVQLYNNLGALLQQHRSLNGQMELNIEGLAEGAYTLRFQSNSEIVVRKLQVQ